MPSKKQDRLTKDYIYQTNENTEQCSYTTRYLSNGYYTSSSSAYSSSSSSFFFFFFFFFLFFPFVFFVVVFFFLFLISVFSFLIRFSALGQVYTSYVDTIASLLVLPSARYGRPSSSNSVAESFPLPFFISIVDFWRELFPH